MWEGKSQFGEVAENDDNHKKTQAAYFFYAFHFVLLIEHNRTSNF
jgi:hypothetical protein